VVEKISYLRKNITRIFLSSKITWILVKYHKFCKNQQGFHKIQDFCKKMLLILSTACAKPFLFVKCSLPILFLPKFQYLAQRSKVQTLVQGIQKDVVYLGRLSIIVCFLSLSAKAGLNLSPFEIRARNCKLFKEPRNRFPAWAGTTTLFDEPARQPT
jgi:hypothetical protein